MHIFCVACLDPAPCSNKEGSFRWGFCKKSGVFSKMIPFCMAGFAGIAAWPVRKWHPSTINDPFWFGKSTSEYEQKVYIFFL
jgi:hypothetical protein